MNFLYSDAALLEPQSEFVLARPGEPLARHAGGEVRIGLLDFSAWRQRDAGQETDRDRLEQGFAQFEMRQRQYAAVLQAHGVPVQFVHCPQADAGCLA